MRIDIEQLRKEMADYRKAFNREFRNAYGVEFGDYVNAILSTLHHPNGTATEAIIGEYQGRLRKIKAVVEQKSPNPNNYPPSGLNCSHGQIKRVYGDLLQQ